MEPTRWTPPASPPWAAAPATIAIEDGQIAPQQCGLYLSHWCAILQAHHVIPQSWWKAAGREVASPLRNLCPNCHMNTHAAIDALLHDPPRSVGRLPPRCVALATEGIGAARREGLTPARTL